ncbi:hypothetical protein OKW21_002927 [Catalinimonas alkaloidigena]|nr:hypothetical protein [Catalinimonas alkaloidigena]
MIAIRRKIFLDLFILINFNQKTSQHKNSSYKLGVKLRKHQEDYPY